MTFRDTIKGTALDATLFGLGDMFSRPEPYRWYPEHILDEENIEHLPDSEFDKLFGEENDGFAPYGSKKAYVRKNLPEAYRRVVEEHERMELLYPYADHAALHYRALMNLLERGDEQAYYAGLSALQKHSKNPEARALANGVLGYKMFGADKQSQMYNIDWFGGRAMPDAEEQSQTKNFDVEKYRPDDAGISAKAMIDGWFGNAWTNTVKYFQEDFWGGALTGIWKYYKGPDGIFTRAKAKRKHEHEKQKEAGDDKP
jgi:hypothetical protein